MSDDMTLTYALMDVSANSQRQVYRLFARHLARRLCLSEAKIHTRISTLKGNESAAIGGGVLMIHGWDDMATEPVFAFARLKSPIIIPAAVDREPADLVVLLLSPKTDGPVHLSRLSRLSRMMRDDHIRDMLRGATSTSAVEAIFANELQAVQKRHAA